MASSSAISVHHPLHHALAALGQFDPLFGLKLGGNLNNGDLQCFL